MKIMFLAIAASCTSLFLAVFAVFLYSTNSDDNLVSVYAYAFRSDLTFFSWPITLGAILLALIVTNMILKIKKIPARRYMLVMAAGALMCYGCEWIGGGLWALVAYPRPINWGLWPAALVTFGTGALFLIPGIIALKKAGLKIRKQKPDPD